MADTKATGLTELVGPPADDDMLYLADVSDTAMAASGTSKKNQGKNYVRTNGTANTLGANIAANGYNFTGAGTVSTAAMLAANCYGGTVTGGTVVFSSTTHATKGKILLGTASAYDEVNNRLGIGTLSPTYGLDVNGSFQCTQMGVAWNGLSFGSGWANYGGSYQTGQVKKVGDLVLLRGLVYRFTGSVTTIATLPAGFRPPAQVLFIVDASGSRGRIDIDASGNIILQDGSPSSYLQLDGIVFSTV